VITSSAAPAQLLPAGSLLLLGAGSGQGAVPASCRVSPAGAEGGPGMGAALCPEPLLPAARDGLPLPILRLSPCQQAAGSGTGGIQGDLLGWDLNKCMGVPVSRLHPRGRGASLCHHRLRLLWFVPQQLPPCLPLQQLPLLMPVPVPAPPPD